MPAKQKTIKYSVSCTGVGLHTGVQSTITFHPAEENTGIIFVRTDLKKNNVISVNSNNIVKSKFCSKIKNKFFGDINSNNIFGRDLEFLTL